MPFFLFATPVGAFLETAPRRFDMAKSNLPDIPVFSPAFEHALGSISDTRLRNRNICRLRINALLAKTPTPRESARAFERCQFAAGPSVWYLAARSTDFFASSRRVLEGILNF
ncbi:hypothetical protein VTN00DRAFT_6544 [Thermoascus crustaceus]|uniref:uncharacterized protein n=1 Tax=Thermoascus crustaceus TaxID=5088 RepID=UPI0037439F7B